MSTKIKTYGIMIIAAVLLVAMAFAGAASAAYPVPQSVENPSVDVVYDNGTHHVEVVSGTAYLISTEDDWRHVVDNSSMWDKTHVLTNDITFTDSVGSIGNSGTKFSGSIYGNGSKFVNFTQSGNTAQGLIYYATENCVLNNVHMYDSNINSGSYCVGGLVGTVASDATNNGVRLCGCSVRYSNVTSSGNDVGGLVGTVDFNAKLWVNASWVDHAYVSSGDCDVGGLVGYTSNAITVCVNNSRVESSEIYAEYGCAGGLVGVAGSDKTFRNTSVRDCKIWSGATGGSVGGLIGSAGTTNTVNGCAVENCTMMSDNDCVGGLAGLATFGISFDGVTSWVNYTWVKGSSSIGSLIGYAFSQTSPAGGHYMVCNCTGVSYTSLTGVDNSFNGTYSNAATAFVDGIGSHIGQDMIVGKDYGYGSAPATPYGITITNATGTYPLTSALTTVYGDDPATDGTAVLTFENSKPVLTLNGFKASNTTGNVPIINANVADLTIVLNGESNLTGCYAKDTEGLLYSFGNLTINGTNSASKLLVSNTNSSSNAEVTSIYVMKYLTLDNAVVTATAASASGKAYAMYVSTENLEIKASTVKATANSTNGNIAEALRAYYNITISDNSDVTAIAESTDNANVCAIETYHENIEIKASTVKATANSPNGNYVAAFEALYNITISDNSDVTAIAESTGNAEVYAIAADNGDLEIKDSTVTANANSTSDEAYSLYADQNIKINSVDVLNATACGNQFTAAIYSDSGDITVKGADTKIYAKAESSNDRSDAIWGSNSIQIDSAKLINATTDGCTYAYALGSSNDINITNAETICANANASTGDAYAIFTWNTDILIDSVDVLNATACGNNLTAAFYTNGWVGSGDITVKGANTKINAKAESISQDAYAIYIAGKIGISSLQTLTAIGTTSSFAYYTGPCDVTDLSDYTFSNASVPGDEPNSYTAFTDNWYIDSINYHCSNFTAVKIEKGSGIPASIKVTVSGTNAGTDPVNLTLTPVSTGTSGTYDIGTNTTYTIKPVTPGVYSLDAIYTNNSMEHKLTKQVTVTASNRTDVTFDLLTTNVTTKVNTNQATSAPNVAVDGLDTVAKTIQPAAGQKVIISLGVDGTSGTSTADQQMLKSNRTYSAGTPSFINFTVTNTTSYVNGTVISNSTMDNLSTVLTIYVAYDMTRENIEVFRIHNGTVENFTETSTLLTTPVDRYFFKGESGIYIYTQKFSTYMISSTGPSSPVTPSSGGSSSSHHSGSSQLAKSQDVYVTPEPTVVPTQAQSTVIPTPVATSATTQPTQSSPAPIAGIIAGLGAAALVFSRLRK